MRYAQEWVFSAWKVEAMFKICCWNNSNFQQPMFEFNVDLLLAQAQALIVRAMWASAAIMQRAIQIATQHVYTFIEQLWAQNLHKEELDARKQRNSVWVASSIEWYLVEMIHKKTYVDVADTFSGQNDFWNAANVAHWIPVASQNVLKPLISRR